MLYIVLIKYEFYVRLKGEMMSEINIKVRETTDTKETDDAKEHYSAYLKANGLDENKIPASRSERMHGRRKIVLDATEINDSNVIATLVKAVNIHEQNRSEIEYLYDYKRGIQPSLQREKKVRPEIVAHIVENRAAEFVDFRTGYMCGESKAIQYIASCADARKETLTKLVARFNEYMDDVDMPTIDKDLFDWEFTCGVGYKIILPKKEIEDREHGTPFESYILNPMNTFVVYSNEIGEPATMGVNYVYKEDGTIVYTCYTKNTVYTIAQYVKEGQTEYSFLANPKVHYLRDIPIVEYIDNKERMGVFEKVITLLDAINDVACNRKEAVEQYVQALLLIHNVSLTEDQFDALIERGAIQYDDVSDTKKGEIKYISLDLNQSNTQTLVDHMIQTAREICGIPSMSDGSTSDSSNNGAVIMRQGWGIAEARAKNSEQMFKVSERKFIKLALYICDMNAQQLRGLTAKDIEIRFTRRNYEDIQTKAQVLKMLIPEDFKVDPKLGFEHCGLFVDPERSYLQSKEYTEEQNKKAQNLISATQTNNLEEVEEDTVKDKNGAQNSPKRGNADGNQS